MPPNVAPIVIGVVAFIAVAGTAVALWWWKIADRWVEEEERRFKSRGGRKGPDEIIVSDAPSKQRTDAE